MDGLLIVDDLHDLTGDPSEKTTDELWALVREACRGDTPTWRAYERLHSEFNMMQRRDQQASPEAGVEP